jgi:hypothetical protein
MRQTKNLINTGRLKMSKQYYVDLKDGYEIGDTYIHDGDDTKKYIIVDIEAFNDLMLVEEIDYDIELIWEYEDE